MMSGVLRLPYSPGSLAETAMRCSTWRAVLAGAVSLTLQSVAPFAAIVGSINEPYRDLAEYFRHAAMAAVPLSLVALCLWSAGCTALVVVFRTSTLGLARTHTSTHLTTYARVLLLSPVTFLLPGVVLSIFSALKYFSLPRNGFTIGVKPTWLTSPVINVLGSGAWVLAGVVSVLAVSIVAFTRVHSLCEARRCKGCLYDLTGNVSGVCPECGLRFTDPVDAAKKQHVFS